jgi:hypothetical protein
VSLPHGYGSTTIARILLFIRRVILTGVKVPNGDANVAQHVQRSHWVTKATRLGASGL